MEEVHVPNFLSHLSIDKEGGVDKIAVLWDPMKLLWFLIIFGSILMNCTMVAQSNFNILYSLGIFSAGDFEEEMDRASKILSRLNGQNDSETMTFNNATKMDDVQFFRHMTHIVHKQTQGQGLLVCVFELGLLSFYISKFLRHLFYILCKDGYPRWSNMSELSTDTLPTLATFSALKMMRFVHPALVAQQLINFLQEHSKQHRAFYTLVFILTRLLCLVFGIIAFGHKLLDVGIQLMQPEGSALYTWMFTCAFLNQCMGIVYLDDVLQERLFLFIFGGCDAEFQDEERVLKHVYMARLMRGCWNEFGGGFLARGKGFLVMTTLDHYDIQKLIINEDEDLKKRATEG